MKSKKVMKPKSKPRKQPKKIKQKQSVKQSVKVNVQSSGGSGAGGPSIPTIPQYIPQQVYQPVPQVFQDRRGEDVFLQRLSEIVDRFDSKSEPVEALPKTNPQPTEYINSAVDAVKTTPTDLSIVPSSNQSIVTSKYQSAPPPNQNVLTTTPLRISNKESNPSVYIGGRSLYSEESENPKQGKKQNKQDGVKVSVLRDNSAIAKKGHQTRKLNKEKQEAEKLAKINAIWADDENESANDLIASKYFEERARKKAVKRLKENADNLNSDVAYRELKRDYNESKLQDAQQFTAPSPINKSIVEDKQNKSRGKGKTK
jgi:hypothetical protein